MSKLLMFWCWLMLTLTAIVDHLRKLYGPPPKQKISDPFEMILWELSAELATDEKRGGAFAALKTHIGTHPKEIAAAPPLKVVEVARLGGMEPERRARRMQDAAALALAKYGGDLRSILKLPLAQAKKALRKFPSVGEPGAEKILMLTRSYPLLSLESNGLRVLRRLGFGEERKDYSAIYRSVQEHLAPQVAAAGYDTLIAAHKLLRRHGQELCKTARPLCSQCPLLRDCPSGAGILACR
jgi:endonuclease III